jgi:hypothetical protein
MARPAISTRNTRAKSGSTLLAWQALWQALGLQRGLLDHFRIHVGRACALTRALLGRCAPGARVTPMQGRAGDFVLVTWPHMGVRVEPAAASADFGVAPRELLVQLTARESVWLLEVGPRDRDGRAQRFVRRLAFHWDGLFTDGRAWWDGTGRCLAGQPNSTPLGAALHAPVRACSPQSGCPRSP